MSRLDEMKKELAKKHAESEGDNGNTEISFNVGFDAWVEAQKELIEELIYDLEKLHMKTIAKYYECRSLLQNHNEFVARKGAKDE